VRFEEPLRGVAPQQAIALYRDDECLGGAAIRARGRTLWEEARGLEQQHWSHAAPSERAWAGVNLPG